MGIVSMVMPYIVGIVAIVLVVLLILVMYRKAPPNVAMVITGPRGSKTVTGQGCFVIPFFERVDTMPLGNISCDFQSRQEIPTRDAINITVDAIATFSISTDPKKLSIAARKFLGKNTKEIKEIVQPILEGNIREIISQVELKALIQGDKKAFAQLIMQNVCDSFEGLGLELTTFNIQNFTDKNGVIKDLGLENTVQISKDASVSKAKAQQEIEVAKAEALAIANEAQVKTQELIAQRENDLAIKKAELMREQKTKQAIADAAYEIQKEEQRKTIELATADANLARQEKAIELKEREVRIKEQELEAGVKKEAEAKKFAMEKEADARKYSAAQVSDANLYKIQKDAEAEKYQREKKAEVEAFEAVKQAEAIIATADANRKAMEAEAAGIKAKGEAEAEAIKAKALAEAEGIRQKAEAMQQYGEASKNQQMLDVLTAYINVMPAIAKGLGESYQNVDKIVMYGDSTPLMNDMMTNFSQLNEVMSQSAGIDLKSVLSGIIGGKIAQPASTTTVKIESANE